MSEKHDFIVKVKDCTCHKVPISQSREERGARLKI